MPKHDYYIKCETCDETMVEADNPQKLLEHLFQSLAEHNHGVKEICSEATDEISMDNVRSAFASENYQVYEATKHEERPVEWDKAGYGGLKE